MLPRYKKINLCFTDTDSLLYEVFTDDIYDDMRCTANEYDFSEYPFNHHLYSTANKKVIGKFKDELNGMTLEEFVGLRAKCYSLLFRGVVKDNIVIHMYVSEKQIAKGTKKCVKKKYLRHHHFKTVLTDLSVIRVKQNAIRSKHHKLGTYNQTRIALTAFDTKRWIRDDGIHTLAHGHYETRLGYGIHWDEQIDYL